MWRQGFGPSLLLVRGPATNINVCYLSSAKHKLNPPWGHAPAAYRGRWFPYVQYRGSHTRTLFALWRLKVFKIWIEECNDNREPCPGVRRGISKPSLVSALQESFFCRNLIMFPMEELRRLKCFQTRNSCIGWLRWQAIQLFFFPDGEGLGIKTSSNTKYLFSYICTMYKANGAGYRCVF